MKFPPVALLKSITLGVSLALACPAFSANAFAAPEATQEVVQEAAPNPNLPKELQNVGITEHLGAQVSIQDLKFHDDAGKEVALSEYFHKGRPVLLTLIYYECPNLCNYVLNGIVKSLRGIDWTAGKQFDVVAVSINPKEKPELASKKKAAYVKSYGRAESAAGWHFLTGDEAQIDKLASEIGFGYKWQGDQYAHAAATYVLTPEGRISRYLYGTDYPQLNLRMSLLEASNGKIGTIVDRILLFCYRYNPQTGKYSLSLTHLMQAACAGTVLVFGAYLAVFWRRQRRPGVEA